MKIAIVIATVGRAALLQRTVDHLASQTRVADKIIVSVPRLEDAGALDQNPLIEVVISAPGLCDQRNAALDAIVGSYDVISFLDDDFIPADNHTEELERIFLESPGVIGVTGFVIKDGAIGPGVEFDEALRLLEVDEIPVVSERPAQALYGCNMAYRASAIQSLRFDKNLPLYAWLEDIDFSRRAAAAGQLIRTSRLRGVHLGIKRGRTSGVKLGYSQVANIYYLSKKGTMQPGLGRKLLINNVGSNIFRSVNPEPYIDRRGRFKGNMLAIRDILRGRSDPRRINDL